MKVVLLRHTQDPDRVCAAAAASCYSADGASQLHGSLSDKRVERLLRHTVGKGHHSVVEHAVFTFSIEGVSRSLTHQLVRHRIASYSQQSQRYVRMDVADYVTPPEVEKLEGGKETFDATVMGAWEVYRDLVDRGVPVYAMDRICHFLAQESAVGGSEVGDPFGRERASRLLQAGLDDYAQKYPLD